MPIYEYQCETCSFEFEELVRGGDKVTCPHCKSDSVRRKMSTFSKKSCGGCGVGAADGTYSATSSGSKCSGCSGGNCSCCHH